MRADEMPEVAGAQVDDAVLEIEPLQQRRRPTKDVGVDGVRLLGGRVGEELDLVELVHAEQPARVAPRRSGLAPEARGRCREPRAEDPPRRGSRCGTSR